MYIIKYVPFKFTMTTRVNDTLKDYRVIFLFFRKPNNQ